MHLIEYFQKLQFVIFCMVEVGKNQQHPTWTRILTSHLRDLGIKKRPVANSMLGIVVVKIENHGIDQFYGTVMSSAMVIAHHIGIYMGHQWGLTISWQPTNTIFVLPFSNLVSSTFEHEKIWIWNQLTNQRNNLPIQEHP